MFKEAVFSMFKNQAQNEAQEDFKQFWKQALFLVDPGQIAKILGVKVVIGELSPSKMNN